MSVGSKTANSGNRRKITAPYNVHEWTVQDVADWLRENEFVEYLNLFVQHKIDGTVLLALNEKDLRKAPLSIEKLGDVKKLYFSISRLQLINLRTSPSSNTLSVGGSPGNNPNRPCWDFNSAEILQLKEQIKNELQHSSSLRKRYNGSNGFKTNDLSAMAEGWSDLNGNDLHADSTDMEDNDNAYDENVSQNFQLLRMPKGEYQQFRPEAWKALIAMLYFFAVTWITAIVMVIVHDRVPDMQTYPPLPDIFLDNVPLIPGAFTMCELCGLILFIMTALLLIFHKHRFILIRRMFSLFGSVFLLRCITMLITSLSVPGRHLDCKARHASDWLDKMKQAFLIWQGGGMSIQGVRTCGDYMFSGHTVVLTLLNFFITEYTPQRFYFVHTISWVLNLFGVFFILAGHEHYSIDVFIAFYISTRLFLYYHTLANNRALYQGDRKRTRIWFPLFYFFESGVNGIVPNHFEIPCKNLLLRLRKRYHNCSNLPLSSFSPSVSEEDKRSSNNVCNSSAMGNDSEIKSFELYHSNSGSESQIGNSLADKPLEFCAEEKTKKPKKKKKKKEN